MLGAFCVLTGKQKIFNDAPSIRLRQGSHNESQINCHECRWLMQIRGESFLRSKFHCHRRFRSSKFEFPVQLFVSTQYSMSIAKGVHKALASFAIRHIIDQPGSSMKASNGDDLSGAAEARRRQICR
jgi:hypothetical protein